MGKYEFGTRPRAYAYSYQQASKIISDAHDISYKIYKALTETAYLELFEDIPASWLDGGPSKKRMDDLVSILGRNDTIKVLGNVMAAVEEWQKTKPKEMGRIVAEYWKQRYPYGPNTEEIILKAADQISASMSAVVKELGTIKTGLEKLAKTKDQDEFMDGVDAVLKSLEKALDSYYKLSNAVHVLSAGPNYYTSYRVGFSLRKCLPDN